MVLACAGFDSCSHLSEEIKGANSSAPLAMLWAILAIALLGYALLLAMLFCVQVTPCFFCNAQSGTEASTRCNAIFRCSSGLGRQRACCKRAHHCKLHSALTHTWYQPSFAGHFQNAPWCCDGQDSDNLMNPVAAGPGYAAGQLVYDVFGARFGSGAWSATVLGIFFLAGFMCTIACVTSTSRCAPERLLSDRHAHLQSCKSPAMKCLHATQHSSSAHMISDSTWCHELADPRPTC